MANAIDILINATWRGGAATNQAQQGLRNLGNTASQSSVEMAAAAQRSSLLQTAMQNLGREVALGNLTVEQAREAYNQYAGQLTNVGGVAQGAGTKFAALAGPIGVATAALGALAVAGKRAFEAIEEGAGLELTQRRFDRLAESAGTTGDAFRRDLREATRGMISDTEAMSLATDLLALDLASSADQAVRMSRVVTELDQDIGQLTLALTNQTTKRFDQLGVSTAGFEERLKELKKTMSDEEAFTMAFLEQAEAQIERVGGASDTAAGDLARMEAASANLSDSFKVALVREFSDELGILGDNAEKAGEKSEILGTALGTIVSAGLEGALNQILPLNLALEALGITLDKLTEGGSKTTGKIDKVTESIEGQGETAAGSTEELERLAKAVQDIELKELIDQAGISGDTFTRLANQLGGVARATEYLQQTMERGGEITAAFGVSVQELEKTLGGQLFSDRVDLWFDFQEDLSDISAEEGERRAEIEGQYEERRSEIVARHGAERAQEEEDWLRQRARAEAQLQRDITKIQEEAAKRQSDAAARLQKDITKTQEELARKQAQAAARLQKDITDLQAESAEKQAELRADANTRLAELEQDHLDRMRQIIEDADLQLKDAASRLDASAVARIERQKEQALQRETEQYQDQRSEIIRTLEERLAEERRAEARRIEELKAHHAERAAEEAADAARRIEELKAHHAERAAEEAAATVARIEEMKTEFAERQALEEEDRRIRLQRQEDAHQEQLRELDDNYRRQLAELRANSAQQRQEREMQFRKDYAQLVDYWGNRQEIESARQAEALQEIDKFWKNVIGGIPTSASAAAGAAGIDLPASSTPPPPPAPSTPPPPPAPADPGKPTRGELERRAQSLMGTAGWTSSRIFAQLQTMKDWSDAQVARWIEDTFDFDVPGYQMGTPFVPRTGPAILHQGEAVLDVAQASRWRAGQGSMMTIESGAIVVNAAPGQSPEAIALAVDARLKQFYRTVAG